MLDCVEPEVAPQPDGWPPRPEIIIERCKTVWESFKTFNHDAVISAATHTLAMIRSHYLATNLQVVGEGFAEGLGEVETDRLEDEEEDVAKKLAGDIDLFGDMDGDGDAR